MSNKHIIFVPGKNPKPPVSDHKNMIWRTLLEGVRRANPGVAAELEQNAGCLELAAWNYLYYEEHTNADHELPWIDALIDKKEPTDIDIKEAHSWNLALNKMIYSLADVFPALIKWAPSPAGATIRETRRYFKNTHNIAYQVRGLLKQILRPMLDRNEAVLVIAHSFGSIIAFDTFWELSQLEHRSGKLNFLSLGSPLGMNYEQHRLQGKNYKGKKKYPNIIQHWMNVSAVGDIAALDSCFSNDYRKMPELGIIDSIDDRCKHVYNYYRNEDGMNCHRSYGYLVTPVVGELVANWWQE